MSDDQHAGWPEPFGFIRRGALDGVLPGVAEYAAEIELVNRCRVAEFRGAARGSARVRKFLRWLLPEPTPN
jgi:hypothetical protein